MIFQTRHTYVKIAKETTLWEQLELPFHAEITQKPARTSFSFTTAQTIGIGLIALALGGITGPLAPVVAMESSYYIGKTQEIVKETLTTKKPLPKSAPVVFNPLVAPDGSTITPVNTDFAVIVPKIGINAKIVGSVNPIDKKEYTAALKSGVAHASTSFFPDQNGVVYLFSHSTNYEWFIKDLNAIFYLLKNLELQDKIILIYKGKRYTYALREKRIVEATETSYMMPIKGQRTLILQTCWPPGSTYERLLLFADLVDEQAL